MPDDETDPERPGSRAGPTELEAHRDDGLDLARRWPGPPRGARRAAAPEPKRGPTPAARRGRAFRPHPDDRDPQLLDSRRPAGHRPRVGLELRVHGVFAPLGRLVGAEVAAHCTPETFADGKLVVRTDSTAWATQLKLLAPTVVRRLNEELGHGTSPDRGAGPARAVVEEGPRSVRDGRGPRDTYG